MEIHEKYSLTSLSDGDESEEEFEQNENNEKEMEEDGLEDIETSSLVSNQGKNCIVLKIHI